MALSEGSGTISLPLHDISQVGEARRKTVALAKEAGCDETRQGKLAILVTEAANNTVSHGRGGEMIVSAEREGMIELFALDRGPGMRDVGACLRDGYSTRGTAGNGLGALRRLSDVFALHSHPTVGTAVYSRLYLSTTRSPPGPFEIGAVSVPYPGETVCGDTWAAQMAGSQCLRLLVADGLGHGRNAAEAALEGRRIFLESRNLSLAGIFDRLHLALRKTRGAAVSLFDLDAGAKKLSFVGVGNVAGILFQGEKRSGCSAFGGIVGHEMRRIQEFHLPLTAPAHLVVHTDGLTSRWTLDAPAYVGLLSQHPSLVAAVLYRDFRRERDDVTVVVVHPRNGTEPWA